MLARIYSYRAVENIWRIEAHYLNLKSLLKSALTGKVVIATTQFLFWHQVKYVLTKRFRRDPLENWFGRQRSLGLRKDNPSMADFRYNNVITNQKNQSNR